MPFLSQALSFTLNERKFVFVGYDLTVLGNISLLSGQLNLFAAEGQNQVKKKNE